MQINNTNFIRFYTDAVIDNTINIPRLAVIDNKTYLPVYVSGERSAFYINATIPFLDGDDIANLILRIVDGNGNIISNLGAILQRVALTDGYRMYADFIFPDVANGQYQFQIFNTNTNIAKCASNWFSVLDIDTADSITASVVWRNSRSSYYYDWTLFPDLYSRIRLHLSLQSYLPEGNVDQLQSVSTGRRRNLNRIVDKSIKLQTYYFDDGANDASISLFEADDIQINGRQYLAKTIYNPNARGNSKVSTGEIELYEQDFSSINKFGQLPAPLTNQGYIAFWNRSETIFSFKTYLQNNILFQSIDVAAGGTLYFPIINIPYGGRVDIVPAAPDDFDLLVSNVSNGVASFNDSVQSGAVVASLTRAHIYNTDWFISVGGDAIETVPVKVTVFEQPVPYVDSNGQLKVGGVPAINLVTTGTQTVNVPVGSICSMEAYGVLASESDDPLLTMLIKNNGATVYNNNTPSIPGASMVYGFTIMSGDNYEISVISSGD